MDQVKDSAVTFWIVLVIMAIMIYIQIYAMYKYTLSSKECSYWDKFYKNVNGKILNMSDSDYKYPDGNDPATGTSVELLDYNILSAYNCCSSGAYKNDYVNTCILIDIIKQGVRCLDFEIYSLKDEPIISTSTESNYNVKQTFNFVKFADAMKIIANNSFSASTAPNPNDPLIIHLRIKSTNIKMYNKLSKIFESYGSLFAGKEYSYNYDAADHTENESNESINLGKVPLEKFKSKIIVAVDGTNKTYLDTDLFEWINILSGTNEMNLLRYNDVKNTASLTDMIETNKHAITMVIPDNKSDPENPNGSVCREMGCQIVAMRFQLNDDYFKENMKYFNNAGTAFVLKPLDLRTLPISTMAVKPQDEANSYATREIKNKLYNFKI